MQSPDGIAGDLIGHNHDYFSIALAAAAICLIWYIAVALVCTIGYVQISRHYSHPPDYMARTDSLAGPHVTIIRPVKGLEPCLYSCLASTFRQVYPSHKVRIRFCISSRLDPAHSVLQGLLRDFPGYDAQILVEEEDEELRSGRLKLGPNPKIRNMSRAYREAVRGKGDVVWIVDCNVWVGPHTLGRMLLLERGNKFVHQLPLVVDVGHSGGVGEETAASQLVNDSAEAIGMETGSGAGQDLVSRKESRNGWLDMGGGRLEELFMSSSHAKFYTAINTVLIAPCIVGKSTMFSIERLNSLTNGRGIDYFSQNICEDHLIGDLLWKQKVPEERTGALKLGKHALCFGDLAIQPMRDVSVREYWERRVRWLRVRKFTVTLATLVEPGTESFLCSAYGAFAVTTLPFFQNAIHMPPTWTAFTLFWLLSVTIWCAMDWKLYRKLHSGASIHTNENIYIPEFARPIQGGRRRPFREWLLAWLGREALALPIWLWAFWGGTEVEWRGKKFWVGVDMKVHEITNSKSDKGKQLANGHTVKIGSRSKDRLD